MGSWNSLTIWGLILLIIGIIMVMVGVVIYETNIRDRKKQSPWTYFLLIGGAIVTAIGGILLGIGLVKSMYTQQTTIYYRSPTSSAEFQGSYIATPEGGFQNVYIPPGGYTTITGGVPPVIVPQVF